MTSYRAFRIHNENSQHQTGIEDLEAPSLEEGEVQIRTRYSSINYKDALAGTGKGKILRHFPLVGGIDSAGDVVASEDRRFKEGDQVLVTGCGLSVTHDGGYAELLTVPADWVVPLPDGLGPYEAMAIGTAGFAAALSIHRMEVNGQVPEKGPIVVTGASGGVGCLAIDMLSNLGYQVTAVSGKPDQYDFLVHIGADEVIGRDQLPLGRHPLEKGLWGGAIDNVGGETLAGLTRSLKPWGNIASVGLAGGHELHTTVMPFIIRGVCLLGINSADCPYELRRELWTRLAGDLHPRHLDEIVDRVVSLEDLPSVFEAMMDSKTHGRTVVQTAE